MPVQTNYSTNHGKAYAGLVVRADLVVAKKNAEASASIPFGRAVCPHSTDEDGAILPAAETDKVIGIVARYQNHSMDVDLDSTGLKVGATMDVLRKGAIYVVAEDAPSYLGRGWVRCTAGGDAAEVVGGITTADEGTETIDTTNQIGFEEAGAAGDLVLIEVDFTREA